MHLQLWLAFVAASAVLLVIPGPTILTVISFSVANGRRAILPLAGATLILVAFTGQYRRVERIALIFGLFGIAFLFVAWQSHPGGGQMLRDIADQQLHDTGYLYLAAGLIGATFNPWMIFYQASAISEKRLTAADYGAARGETIFGASLTQVLTASVLVAVSALKLSK